MTEMAVVAHNTACPQFHERADWRLPLMRRHAAWLDLFYGIEVRNGWQAIVTEMMDEIHRILWREMDGRSFRVFRLAEQDGCLVVEVRNLPPRLAPDLRRVIGKAQERARITCEVCGELHSNHGADSARGGCWSF